MLLLRNLAGGWRVQGIVSLVAAGRITVMSRVGRMVAGGVVVVVLAGCAASAPATGAGGTAAAPAVAGWRQTGTWTVMAAGIVPGWYTWAAMVREIGSSWWT